MHLLRKILEKAVSPLGLALTCLFLAAIFAKRSGRAVRLLSVLGFLSLLIPSMPVVSALLLKHLESFVPAAPLSSIPPASAIVVLGGTVAPQWGETYLAEELGGSRLLTALRLYHAGKAPKIIVSSGMSYRAESGEERTEAEDMREILLTMGVPPADIIMERRSLNTQENASYTAAILKESGIKPDILLVSTAIHLRRADYWFQHAGMSTHPVGAGYEIRLSTTSVLDFIPSATALARSTAACKEYLGYALRELS